MSLILIFFSLILSMNTQAYQCAGGLDSNSLSNVSDFFHQDFLKEGSIYHPRQCGRNVKELLLDLKNHGVDLHNTEVLFLLNEYHPFFNGPTMMPAALHPARSRQNVQSWDFHVILRYNNPTNHRAYIMDLDGPAQPTPIYDYFKYMFPNRRPGEDRLKNITVRPINSEKYLAAFDSYHRTRDPRKSEDDNYVVGDFRNANEKDFPTVRLSEYLKN